MKFKDKTEFRTFVIERIFTHDFETIYKTIEENTDYIVQKIYENGEQGYNASFDELDICGQMFGIIEIAIGDGMIDKSRGKLINSKLYAILHACEEGRQLFEHVVEPSLKGVSALN